MKLPLDLQKWRDELALEHAIDSTDDGYALAVKAGFDACYEKLCSENREFDESELASEFSHATDGDREAQTWVLKGARWQHEQGKARAAALQAEIKRLNYNYELLSKEMYEVINNQDEFRWAYWRKRSGELLERMKELESVIEHALELGHLGEGSTRSWAIRALGRGDK